MKTLWKNAEPLRRPNGQWRVCNAARWFEDLLGVPHGTVVFKRPDGQEAKPAETVGSLRSKAPHL